MSKASKRIEDEYRKAVAEVAAYSGSVQYHTFLALLEAAAELKKEEWVTSDKERGPGYQDTVLALRSLIEEVERAASSPKN